MIKSYLCTLSIIILTASTKLSCLLKALEKLKFPSLFIMIFSFMYRYIFVIQDELMVMKRAKESRSVGGSRWFNAKALANILGVLFVRTYERGENIYLAMRSRGFTGEINTIDKFRLKRGDFYFLFMSTFILAGIRILGSY